MTTTKFGEVYTHCYCEENIWLLAKKRLEKNECSGGEDFVVFLSNEKKCIPIFSANGGVVYWDYHVILIYKNVEKKESWVYDLDANGLEFPTLFLKYLNTCLKKTPIQRSFRILPSKVFLETFSSDRSHMLLPNSSHLPEQERYSSPPPSYLPIMLPGIKNNLFSDFVEMNVNQVATHEQFVQMFTTFN
jgi:hypothetical protein